jgi:uncharacterized membrane protein
LVLIIAGGKLVVEPLPRLNYPARPQPAVAAPSGSGLEQAIGLKWAGWIGAVVVVIGGALAVKFAYDQGWWKSVPPQVRLAVMSLAGLALLAAGEWVYRRINVIAAASLFGAGIAIFFLVSYAGFAFYKLYSRDGAFVLMTISTLVGAAVAMRGNMVSIAVLALIGGNVASVAAGFRARSSAVCCFGLALFGLTLLKVVLVDLSQVGRGYRIFSFMVLGLLLLGTSVLYGKLSPRLLGKVPKENS